MEACRADLPGMGSGQVCDADLAPCESRRVLRSNEEPQTPELGEGEAEQR